MATVTLWTLWLNDTLDPSDWMSFPFMSALGSSPQQDVAISRYAGGRARASTTAGVLQQLTATLPACSPEQRVWAESHAGRLLCARDDRGRKFFGVYTNPTVDEHQYNDDCDIGLTINEVSHSEAV